MSLETLDSHIAKGLMQITIPEFDRTVQVTEELPEREMLTGRLIAFMISKINDAHVRAVSMNELVIFELLNDNLKKFGPFWEETVMTQETVGEVSKCFGAVEDCALRRGGRKTSSKILSQVKRKKGWVKDRAITSRTGEQ